MAGYIAFITIVVVAVVVGFPFLLNILLNQIILIKYVDKTATHAKGGSGSVMREGKERSQSLSHPTHTAGKNAVTASTTYGVAQSQQQPSYGVQRLDRSSGALNYFLFFAVAKYHEGGEGRRRREEGNGEASHNRFYE